MICWIDHEILCKEPIKKSWDSSKKSHSVAIFTDKDHNTNAHTSTVVQVSNMGRIRKGGTM